MSFVETIFDTLSWLAEVPCVVEIHAGRGKVTSTASQTLDLIQRARSALVNAEVSPGDRVGLLSPNSGRWVAADLAILAEGAITVPLYCRQDPAELAYMMADSEPTLLLCADARLAGDMRAAWPEHCPILLFDELFSPEPTVAGPADIGPDDTVTIIYSSGTSGPPKGVMLSRANVDFMLPTTAEALAAIRGATSAGTDQVFHFLPFCFAGSRIMLWTQLFRSTPIMVSTDLNELVGELKIADPNYYLNVPAVLERIKAGVGAKVQETGGFPHTVYTRGLAGARALRDGTATVSDRLWSWLAKTLVFPKVKRQIGPSLDFLVCGSAALSAETQWWFETVGIRVFQVYGLTETTGIVTMDRPDSALPGTVGVTIDGVDAQLTDEQELITRGPHVFQGYWKQPEKTAEVLKDGWFYSGDQAEQDAEGRWRIVGRITELLVPESGHNIAPAPIEETLRSHCDGIEHAVIIGHGRPYLTAIVTGPVTAADVQAAVDQTNAEVPHYRKIKTFHVSAEFLTPESGLLTANQKLKRPAIEAHFKQAIEEMYA